MGGRDRSRSAPSGSKRRSLRQGRGLGCKLWAKYLGCVVLTEVCLEPTRDHPGAIPQVWLHAHCSLEHWGEASEAQRPRLCPSCDGGRVCEGAWLPCTLGGPTPVQS